MSSSIDNINNFSRQLFIYGGFFLSAVGIAGSCVNIYLFTRSPYRRVPCTIFVLIGSVIELIILCLALLLYRVINQVLQHDLMAFNLYVCKARLYLVDVCLPVPIWCICLSAFNRFCITSRDALQRQWCARKRSQIMIAVLLLIFTIYRLPDLYYVNIFSTSDRLNCIIAPSAVTYFNLQTYFTFPVLVTTAPLTLLTILTIRTRAHLRLFTVRHTISRIEQQITSMILLQALGASCLVPYTINFFYAAITRFTHKSEYQVAIENCIIQLVTLGFYAHYASGFYIYCIASRDVRRHVRRVWHKIRVKLGKNNQIVPSINLVLGGGRPRAIS